VALGFIAWAITSALIGVDIAKIGGEPMSYRIPDDYLQRGLKGWMVMLVALAGALSPLAAAALARRT
jgi:hypothetical protein